MAETRLRHALVAVALLLAAAPLLPGQGATEKETRDVFRQLVGVAGVSFHEEKVLQKIQELLPKNVKPVIDDMKNLIVIVGTGTPEIMFVAHMDEIGLEVTGINEDGTLKTVTRGGSFTTIWESKVVKIHTKKGVLDGIIGPRKSYLDAAPADHSRDDLVVYTGADSRADAESLGISPGDYVVQPKRVTQLGRYNSAAGSTDDRGGCTAQILALRRLAVKPPNRTVAFAWVVQEETGLSGSAHLAKSLAPRTVFAIDTFVSSDAPFDPKNIGYTPLGKGAVIRAFDSSNISPEAAFLGIKKIAVSRKFGIIPSMFLLPNSNL